MFPPPARRSRAGSFARLIEDNTLGLKLRPNQQFALITIFGASLVIFRTTPTGQAGGKSVLASEGSKNLIGMSFHSPVYPREEFAFNGDSFIAPFVTPGVRSSLGSFLMIHDLVFKTRTDGWNFVNSMAAAGSIE